MSKEPRVVVEFTVTLGAYCRRHSPRRLHALALQVDECGEFDDGHVHELALLILRELMECSPRAPLLDEVAARAQDLRGGLGHAIGVLELIVEVLREGVPLPC